MASHLSEVRHALHLINIDARKDARLADAFARYFRCSEYSSLTWQMTLNAEDVLSLAKIGPSARHIDAHDLSHRVTLLTIPIAVTAAAALGLYHPI
jgi:23S rRNA (guanine745-N1)-methyltransferase